MAIRRGAWLAGLGIAFLLLVAAAPPATRAEAAQAQQADRQALVQGLQAQYEVALIRDRKMADDRETQMIGALEARLRAARLQADSAKGDARQATAALASARADYAKLAAQVAGRDPSAQSDIAALHAQAQSIADQASPAKLAALQRFADGDRTGAWPALEAIAAAEDSAPGVTGMQKAARARELASLRDVMRAHGEATTAEVLALYDKAAVLDPSNFRTNIDRARLARELGDLTRAKAAAQQAVSLATTENERAHALKSLGEEALRQGDRPEAGQDFDQALAIFQKLAAADPTPKTRNDVGSVLQDKGDVDVVLGEFKAAREAYEMSLAIRQRLAAADPSDRELQGYVPWVLQRIGDLDVETGDLAGARDADQQALAIRQQLSAADPNNTDLQYYASGLLRRLGDIALKQNDLPTARKNYQDCLVIRERLSAADPASASLKDAVALDEFDLGEVAFAQNDIAAAAAAYEQSYAIRKALAAADPTDAPLQQLVMKSMTRLARIRGTSVTWPDVAAEYRLIKSQGHLVPNDDKVLDALRKLGLAGDL